MARQASTDKRVTGCCDHRHGNCSSMVVVSTAGAPHLNFQRQLSSKQCLIILDDTIGAKIDASFKTNLDLLFSRGRHYNISIIFISQYIKNYISTTIRNNIDYLLFSVNNYNVIKIIYDLVVYDGSIKDFIKFVNEKTKNYTFLIYNNLNYSDNNFYTISAPKEIEKFDIKF